MSKTKAQFVAALQSLATTGVQVQALETTLNEQMGMYEDRAIQLIIPDLANPTKDNVRLLLHEAGHALLELLPIKMQQAFHKSMRGSPMKNFKWTQIVLATTLHLTTQQMKPPKRSDLLSR